MEKKYQLRDPKAEDIFVMFRIISKIGINNIKKIFNAQYVKEIMASMNEDGNAEENNAEKKPEAIGMYIVFDIASTILENMDNAKTDIYAFLARLSGMKEMEIADMEAADFADMVIDTIQLEGFRDFFQRVLGLFK
jgi:hypothetical protein